MKNSQQNAIDLCKSPWVMDPVTYEFALQVLQDALDHYQLDSAEQKEAQNAVAELQKLYKYALENYQPLDRQPRPQ